MKNIQFITGLLVVSSVYLAGCASGPELDKYSRREMDRPYTLPKGVATWHIPVIYANVQDRQSSASYGPVPVPLLWETSLSDDWNLIWFPLPLGVSHQFFLNEQARFGFTLLNGVGYSSLSGFRLHPTLTTPYRAFLSKDLALEVTPLFSADIPFQSGENLLWTASLGIGPLFQTSEFFAWKPSASFDVAHGPYGQLLSDQDRFRFSNETSASLSLGASAVWSMGRQWDLRPEYHYAGIGSQNQQRVHLAVLDFVHFW